MTLTAAFRMRRVPFSSYTWVCWILNFCSLTTFGSHRFSEQKLGGIDVFLPYIRDYVATFQGKSITTWDWKAHLYAYFEKHGGREKLDALNSVDWDVSSRLSLQTAQMGLLTLTQAWFYGEGLKLPVEPSYDTTLAGPAYGLAVRWDTSRSISDVTELDFTASDVEAFNSNQKSEPVDGYVSPASYSIIVVFLERLATYTPLPPAHIIHLGALYEVATSANAEIRLRFYQVALKDPTSSVAGDLASQALKWVTGRDGTGVIKGRMKFCRPTFRAASKVNATLAREYFAHSKEEFHPIARKLIEKVRGKYKTLSISC